MSVFAILGHAARTRPLHPLFGASAAAAAIVLFTACVRLLVHPLSRAAARGQKARAALAPKIAELRKHKENPEKLQKAVLELHAKEKVSPLSGCLPGCSRCRRSSCSTTCSRTRSAARRTNCSPTSFRRAARRAVGGRARGRRGLRGAGLVYLGLFAIVAAVATFNYRRTKRMMANGSGQAGGDGARAAGARARRDQQGHAAHVLLHAVHRGGGAAGRRAVRGDQYDVERDRAGVLYRDRAPRDARGDGQRGGPGQGGKASSATGKTAPAAVRTAPKGKAAPAAEQTSPAAAPASRSG